MLLRDIDRSNLPTNRSEASESDSLYFYTGRPCNRGHNAPRYTSTGLCLECSRENYRNQGHYDPRPPREEYYEKALKIISDRGGVCISEEYVNAKTPLHISCGVPEHPPFKTTYDNLKQGKWCPRCKADKARGRKKYTLEDMQRIARENVLTCLSKRYLGVKIKLEYACNRNAKHPNFYATPDNILRGKGCPRCGEEKKGRELKPVEDVLQIIQNRGGELVGFIGTYSGYKTRAKIRCANGHAWTTSVHSLLNGSWCPRCIEPIGEQVTRNIFEATFNAPFSKSRPLFLISDKGGRLELDGYNSDIGLAFEYQGPYHFRPDQIIRDSNKRRLCKEVCIELIEIPYIKNPYHIEKVLEVVEAEIHKLFPGKTVLCEAKGIYSQKLNEFRRMAGSHSIELISTAYHGSRKHLLFKCANPSHPPFWQTPEGARNGHWCKLCSTLVRCEKRSLTYFTRLKAFGERVGLELLSNEYGSVMKTYEWKCKSGHIIKRTKGSIRASVKNGKPACTVCAGTIKKNSHK